MKKPKIGVIGLGGQSAFLKVKAFPVPGQTVSCEELFFELGGKGYNQAVAAARYGVDTLFVGAVGEDIHGRLCREDLATEGIQACLIPKQEPTAYAVITTAADGENTVQVFAGAAKSLSPQDLRQPEIAEALIQCDYLLLQNELSVACLTEAVCIAGEYQIPVVLNPAPAGAIPLAVLRACELITPNYGEAKALLGFRENQEVSPKQFAQAMYALGLSRAVITLGAKGALIVENNNWEQIPTACVGKVVDTTGAGDTFNGVLTACLAREESLQQACRIAAVAAGIGVTRPGARSSIPYGEEIAAYVKAN